MIRKTAAIAAIAIGVVALAGCSPTPATPEGLAAAKAQEWREAAYSGDQQRLDALYCDGKASWDTTKVKDWPGDKNSKFDAPKKADNRPGRYVVDLRNPEWPSNAMIYVQVSADKTCVDTVTSPG